MECPICNCALKDNLALNIHLDQKHPFTVENTEDNHLPKSIPETMSSQMYVDGTSSSSPARLSRSAHQEPKSRKSKIQLASSLDPPSGKTNVPKEKQARSCQDEKCLMTLNFINGRHICPRCGRGFCHFHWNSLYEIKIGVDGLHDPIYGTFKTVCRPCFEDRESFGWREGAIRNRMDEFIKVREPFLVDNGSDPADSGITSVELLEQRLHKLMSLDVARLSYSQIRDIEKRIVPWVEDSKSSECWICKEPFAKLTGRKHHCRLCGNVICSKEVCFKMLSLSQDNPSAILASRYPSQQQHQNSISVEFSEKKENQDYLIRCCIRCHRQLSGSLLVNQIYKPFNEVYRRFSHEFLFLQQSIYLFDQNLSLLKDPKPLHVDEPEKEQARIEELCIKTESLRKDISKQFLEVTALLQQLDAFMLQGDGSLQIVDVYSFNKLVKNIILHYKKWIQWKRLTLKVLPPLDHIRPSFSLTDPGTSTSIVPKMQFDNHSMMDFLQHDRANDTPPIIATSLPSESDHSGIFRKWIPTSVPFLSGLLDQKSMSTAGPPPAAAGSLSEPLDPEYRLLLIEQRVQLEQSVSEAKENQQWDVVDPLRAAIEDIDTLLRREYE